MDALCDIPYIRWSPPENLHITTKFIGEWPEERLAEIHESLSKMQLPQAFEVRVGRPGFLPNPHHPKIFFAAIQAKAGLAELAASTESAMAERGIRSEVRAYTPHVTLARIGPDSEALRVLRERIAALTQAGSSFDFGTFTATEFHLYQSKSGSGGSVYSVLASYPLPKAAS